MQLRCVVSSIHQVLHSLIMAPSCFPFVIPLHTRNSHPFVMLSDASCVIEDQVYAGKKLCLDGRKFGPYIRAAGLKRLPITYLLDGQRHIY